MIWVILTYVVLVWYGLHLARDSERREDAAEALADHASAMIAEGSYHYVRTEREAWSRAAGHRRTAKAMRFIAKALAVVGLGHLLFILTGVI